MNNLQKYLSTCLLATAALLVGAAPAFAASSAPSLGSAGDFAVLSVGTATPPSTTADGTAAVTTTRANITGNVGSAGAVSFGDAGTPSVITGDVVLSGAYTQVPEAPPNAFSGSLITPLPVGVITDFNAAYAAFGDLKCTKTLTGTLAGVTLKPGIYCVSAEAKTGVLTLDAKGNANAVWIFLVDGALTGTNFTVNLVNGATACNVYWWVKAAATLTTSDFKGTILAGAAITTDGGTFEGRALAKAAVTLTDATFVGCEGGTFNPPQQRCNQGVGNGTEGCDPGNSNQGNPFRSNDELGGVRGNPGKKGGNK